MNTQTNESNSPRRLWRKYGLRIFVFVLVIVTFLISFYVWFYYTKVEPMERSHQIWSTINLLEKKCPPTMNEKQWEIAIEWTLNLTGNSLLPFEAKLSDLRRFQHELEERAKGKIDMDIILWIWDQHALLTPTGKRYKQKYQQQMLDEMRFYAPKGELERKKEPEVSLEMKNESEKQIKGKQIKGTGAYIEEDRRFW